MRPCVREKIDVITDGAMKKFGLIGHPIAHSLSPALFKAAYDGKYTYDLIEEADFEKAYDRFLQDYHAVNVTAPFKELAYAKADIHSPECEGVGAANMLIKTEDGRILADNSDAMGVSGSVTEGTCDKDGSGKTALVVGCGGAAQAAAYALCELGYRTVILNRDDMKAHKVAGRFSENPRYDISAGGLNDIGPYFRKACVIIYTLPVPIPALKLLSRKDIRGGLFSHSKLVVEANYKDPAFTPDLIERLKMINPKLKYVSGKEWLLHQAVGAYIKFTSEVPDTPKMREVIM